MERLAVLLAGTWLGVQITAGYIAAPLLFEHFNKMDAGNIAGSMFTVSAYWGMAAWLLAYFLVRREQNRSFSRHHREIAPKFMVLLLVLLAVNQFLVTPVIEALKTGGANWLHGLIGGTFGMWHGVSSIIYLLCTLLGVGLLLRYGRFDVRS